MPGATPSPPANGQSAAAGFAGAIRQGMSPRRVFLIGALLMLILAAFAGVTGYATREEVMARELAHLKHLSRALADHVRRIVFNADLALASVEEAEAGRLTQSAESFRQYGASQALYRRMTDILVATSDIDAITLTNAAGDAINTTRSWPAPALNFADRDYFKLLRDNPAARPYVSGALKNRVTGQYTQFVARRIGTPDGRFLGMMTATIAYARMERIVGDALPGEGASIMVFRRDGLLLLRQPEGLEAQVNPEIPRRLIALTASIDEGSLRVAAQDGAGRARLVGFAVARSYPLIVAVTNLEDIVLDGWNRMAGLLALLLGLAICTVALFVSVFSRQSRLQIEVAEAARGLAQANQELAAANKDLESFSYMVSHDLRTPLRGISGYASLLREKLQGSKDTEADDMLGRVVKGVERMGLLIDNLLALARVSRKAVERQDCNLSQIAAAVAQALAEADPARGVQVGIEPDLQAEADPGLLRELMENLLGNAWKFTAGTADAAITVAMERLGNETVYLVRDNGAGFDMRYVDKLFAPFQRLHTGKEFAGTGIGLSIVQRIVTAHGGRIWAEGAIGAGAVFRFTLEAEPA